MDKNVPMAQELTLHDDRLFPPDAAVRAIAQRIYAETRNLPIISPHGHVPPVWIADDQSFDNPTRLLLTPDHYINRLLHANGVDLSTLGVPVSRTDMTAEDNRNAWRTFCKHWPVYNGTAMRYWMTDQLVGVFGVTQRPSEETADEIYDTIQGWIDNHRPRALMDQFNISFIATTDDPADDLAHHDKIAADAEFSARHRVAPTFRPDKYLNRRAPTGMNWSTGSARSRVRTPPPWPATPRRWRSGERTSSRRVPSAPTTRTPICSPSIWTLPPPSGCTARPAAARSTQRRRPRCGVT